MYYVCSILALFGVYYGLLLLFEAASFVGRLTSTGSTTTAVRQSPVSTLVIDGVSALVVGFEPDVLQGAGLYEISLPAAEAALPKTAFASLFPAGPPVNLLLDVSIPAYLRIGTSRN